MHINIPQQIFSGFFERLNEFNAKNFKNSNAFSNSETAEEISNQPNKTDNAPEEKSFIKDSVYRLLTARVKQADIPSSDKKLILRMIVQFFKNGPDEKMKMKFVKQISSLLAVKISMNQNEKQQESQSRHSIYKNQSMDDYLDSLENDALVQLKLNHELQQLTENLPSFSVPVETV